MSYKKVMARYINQRINICSPFFIVTAIAYIALSVAGCDRFNSSTSQMKSEISGQATIAVSRTPLSAPFFIAETKGFFKEEGIDVEIRECIGGHRCLAAMLRGEVDISTASDLPFMFNSFDRNDYVVAATFVHSDNDVKILARKDAGIKSGKDLRGKKVGVIAGASSQFFLDIFLLNNEIEPSEVSVVNIEPEDMAYAMEADRVEAISVWEPFGFETVKLLGDDIVILPHLNIYRETFSLFSRRDFVESRAEIIQRILLALDKAIAYINNNKAEAQDILLKSFSEDKDFIEWIWPDYKFGLSLNQSLIITLEAEAQWAINNNLVKHVTMPNYMDYIYFDALEKIKPEAITIIH